MVAPAGLQFTTSSVRLFSVMTLSGVRRCRSMYFLTFEAFSYFSGARPRVYPNDAAEDHRPRAYFVCVCVGSDG